jgi:micrococcal nuclease
MISYLYHYGFRPTRIIDGDTVEGDLDYGFHHTRHKVRIRLIGVSAPEVKGPTKEAGKAATAKLRELLPLKSDCIIESHDDQLDSFGRILADIWVPSPEDPTDLYRSVNAAMSAWLDNQPK